MILACQRDPYLRTLDTEVVSMRPLDGPHGNFAIYLADTILFPEGGGQPSDEGWLDGELCRVARDEFGVAHYVGGEIGRGPARLELNWERRYDHMQQHTGQHLVTAVAMDRYGWATTSFHLGAQGCSIDLDAESISPSQLAELEAAVNAEVRAGRRVGARLVEVDEMEALGVRSRGLPDGHTGAVRLVEIEGLDLNTCGGTHVASTAELQTVALLGTERVRGGQTRLHYLAGARVRARLGLAMQRERDIARLVSTGPENHADVVAKMQGALKAAERAARDLRGELAQRLGAELAATDLPYAHIHRQGGDMAFLNAIATATLRENPDAFVFLTAADAEKGPGVFLMRGREDLVDLAGTRVSACLEGRGGGRGGRFQGKIGAIENLADALELLASVLMAR